MSTSRERIDRLFEISSKKAAVQKYRSKKEPNVQYWAEQVPLLPGEKSVAWVVVMQADGYPGTEACDDWFGRFEDADAIAQKLANGEDITT